MRLCKRQDISKSAFCWYWVIIVKLISPLYQRSLHSFLWPCLLLRLKLLIIWSKLFITKYFLLNTTIRLITFNLFSGIICSRTRLEIDRLFSYFEKPVVTKSSWMFVCWLELSWYSLVVQHFQSNSKKIISPLKVQETTCTTLQLNVVRFLVSLLPWASFRLPGGKKPHPLGKIVLFL